MDDAGSSDMTFDCIVVGAGVVGTAIARELSGCSSHGRPWRVALVEARADIGDATSKANTAILHTGFDSTPGTLEARLVRRGYELLLAYAGDAGIPVERTGALLVAWTPDELQALPGLQDKAVSNGYLATRIVDAHEVYATVPALGPGALGGLVVPDEFIICPRTTPLAFAHDAIARGVRLHLNTSLTGVVVGPDETVLQTSGGELRTRWLINAAGLGSDIIDSYLGHDRFHLHPRRGQLIVFDKLARPLVDVIVLPVPSKVGKGVLISPTVFGNVMLGPTAEDLVDRSDTATTREGLDFLRGKGEAILPALLEEDVTAMYAGLRAASDQSDVTVEINADQRYVVAGGIRSTGLTASMAIAEHVRSLVNACVPLVDRTDLPPTSRMPNIGEAGMRPFQDADRIAADSAYGEIVCFCERVTRGEIRDALESEIPARDLEGLRRRTRAQMGRCQGFFCGAEVQAMLDGKS
jgi:glycerol-3-phosphate dehydrogenase